MREEAHKHPEAHTDDNAYLLYRIEYIHFYKQKKEIVNMQNSMRIFDLHSVEMRKNRSAQVGFNIA